ncbi:methionyl-tRNA formyltransferase [Candidatus Bipolaricaulota bacterium]|nr:methionyl-tRNA formyltransferase [Candidatus Bipolaricaulota bacterium]
MKLVFIGSADFAVPSLESVAREHDLELVITQPDRAGGRGMEASYTPVKEKALELETPIYQPEDINSRDSLERISQVDPDGFVLAAYGQKVKKEVLESVEWPVNIHGSLLPKYRGAAPINWAVIRGEEVTGVTTIIMDEGIDTGPMLLKKRTEIGENETAGEVHDRLSELAGELVLDTLAGLEEGTIDPREQEGEPSFAPKLSKDDGLVDWSLRSMDIHNHIRGMNPWPGAYSYYNGERVGFYRSRDLGDLEGELASKLPLGRGSGETDPGEIIDTGSIGLVVRCGDRTALKLNQVQPPSKCVMSGTDFVNGYHLEIGDRFTDTC